MKMTSNSIGRRSSTNPVRISLINREDRSLTRSESRKTQTLKPKISITSVDNSHIPRPRVRASSFDRGKGTGKTPLRHAPATPITPRGHLGLPTGRRSLSADRASSIGAKGPRKDRRPLTDKTYQARMLARIDNFFALYHYSSMLNSNGSLKPITLKMFVEVTAHLMKMLNIKQTLTVINYIEELPKIGKKLHYPGIINKSWLKTANAMHSWPYVLGWISWLVEICEIRELAFQKFNLENLPFSGDQREANINKNTFFSMLEFYNAWNDEKLDEEAAMVERYLQQFEEEQGVTEEILNNARSELEEEMDKFQVAEEDANKIDEEVKHLQEILSSLQKEESKQLNEISAKEESLKTINFETEQINAECDALREQIRIRKIQHDELLSTVKQQPMTTVERDKILEKCLEIERYMNLFDEHLEDIRKELYTTDIKLASVNNNVTKALLKYNKEIFMHLSDNIGVNLEELRMPEKGILDPQIMEVLRSKASLLNNLKELLKRQIIEKEHLLEINFNELENLQEKMKILEEESGDVANKIKERKALITKIKTDAKNEEAKLKEEIKNLQNDIKKMQELKPDIEKLSAELKESTDKLDAVRRRKEYIEESAKLFFNRFYEILEENRNELNNILAKYNE
ncbi:kinetochore protein ndc80-like [Osmia bicornis bicornis]|uniref:kinetochore protein ndc80-like n=1 Tax=Osmia bicornis bicornis TaxID=1437191 RepID=UPI001EAEB891|nr:kinetochore protein ndc80-like [Osmia bicornis bicornis]